MAPEFLNADEVAARLRIAAGTVRAWVRSGRLPGLMLGPRCLRIRPADLDAWLARQQQIELQPELPLEDDEVLQHVLDTEGVTP